MPQSEQVLPDDAAVEFLLPVLTAQGRQVWPTDDRDGDGLADLLVYTETDVYWPRGPIVDAVLGDPLFQDPIDGVWPGSDVTGDGLADVWTWDFPDPLPWGEDRVDLHAGPDPGPIVLSIGGFSGRIERADPDGDGAVDLVVLGEDAVGVCPIPALGAVDSYENCTFVNGVGDREFGNDFSSGDLTGDGVDDVLIGSRSTTGTEYNWTPGVYLVAGPWPGEVDLYDLDPPLWVVPHEWNAWPYAALGPVADLDGDGRPEAVVSMDLEGSTFVVSEGGGALAEVARLDGIHSAETADLDGDGALDLLVGVIDEGSVLLGPFAGTVDLGQALVRIAGPKNGAAWRIAAMDRNADGVLDLVVEEEYISDYRLVRAKQVWLIDGPFGP